MAGRGEISKSKVKEWEDKTKNKGSLPEHVKKSAYEVGVKLALDQAGLLKQADVGESIDKAIKATPEQSQRYSGAMRRVAGGAAGLVPGAALGGGLGALLSGVTDDDESKARIIATLAALGGGTGATLGAVHPGFGGALGGAGLGASLGGGLLGSLGYGVGGPTGATVGSILGGLGGAGLGGYAGYRAMKE
jgi:hypothetical protein